MIDPDIIKDVISSIKSEDVSAEGDFAVIRGADFNPVPLASANFHSIPETTSDKKLLFIDGGNQEIIKTPNLSLQFIRIYYTIYQNNKRIKNQKLEFYALIRLKGQQAHVKIYGADVFQKNLEFNLEEFDKEANLSTVGNLIRRLAELKTATLAAKETDIVILDGSLRTKNSIERAFMDQLLNSDAIIAAFSKTSHIVTDQGLSLAAAIRSLKPNLDVWYYHPLTNIDDPQYKANLYFAMLNKHAKHGFLIEINQTEEDIIPLLKANSTDPVFKGYPYALIEADRFARVSEKEKSQLKTILLAKAGKAWKSILEAESPLNAHSILDNIL